MTAQPCDVLIVGGGLVGLAVARHLKQEQRRLDIALLEKAPELAAHQSGRNSGVVHAGIYYEPGSLKARLCSSGHQAMLRYCREHDIPHSACGKVIVACNDDEAKRLDSLFERGIKNQVPGLKLLNEAQLREIEPNVVGTKALWSPVSAIVDYPAVARRYAKDFVDQGGEIFLQTEYLSAGEFNGTRRVVTTQKEFNARLIINCAGLHADVVARDMGTDPGLRIIPFRGDFFELSKSAAQLVKALIYPVPNPVLPFLGVHLTPTIAGGVKAGPNAILATSREGYLAQDFAVRDVVDTLSYGGFWRFAARYVRPGWAEINRTLRKSVFTRSVQRLVPEISADDLQPARSGVRAQAIDCQGRLVDDFRIEESPGAVHVLNAPSPAATSSLMIGKFIAERAQIRIDAT